VPLKLMYPAADIPVIPLAIQPYEGPAHHIALGRALAALRAEDVLVIGSGTFTHNLRRFYDATADDPEPDDVVAFSAWMEDALLLGDTEALDQYRDRAPGAVLNHPTDEHLLPLFFAFGAGGEAASVRRIHASADRGIVRMDAYAFG
jgi:4,5-DOPA dioxygenase extradiol